MYKIIGLPKDKLELLTLNEYVAKLRSLEEPKLKGLKLKTALHQELRSIPHFKQGWCPYGEYKRFGDVPLRRLVSVSSATMARSVLHIGVKAHKVISESINANGLVWHWT